MPFAALGQSIETEQQEGTVGTHAWLNVDYRIFDPIISMLEPDILSPPQFFDRWRGAASYSPDLQLMFAVFKEAVDGFQENVFQRGGKQEELFKDAEAWFFNDDREWPFSFLNLCDVFALDPDYFRSGLLNWRQQMILQRSKVTQLSNGGETRPRAVSGLRAKSRSKFTHL